MTIEKTYMHTGIPVPAKMEGMTNGEIGRASCRERV